MTSVRKRERLLSPLRYRRQTIGIDYSSHYSQSVPNSARYSTCSTPRPRSALDRKWVHRSQGDLTLDMDLQTHPRLQSEFYQELYQKYPLAFRRRLESREAGRKLFNSCLHVRFKEDADVTDDNHDSHGSLRNLHSNTHLTNWDREVGHYLNHKSRSRECVTSVDPSDCSGSVLSVSQRLKLNSQSLNKLLNEDIPFRKHNSREINGQYDSGTENEQTLQDYMLEKSKERSRHRKQQRRIIIQRKIHKNESVNRNTENERNSRRWMSKSVSPSRHLFSYNVPHSNIKHDTHHVNVEDLIADSDLKIETLLEKINAKMSGPESPPDSAIDVDTPSVQSLITPDLKGGNLVKHDSELPPLNGDDSGSFESPGSSASACVREKSAKFYDDIMQEKVSTNTVQCSNNNENIDDMTSDMNKTSHNINKEHVTEEEDEMNRIVEKYGSLENVNQNIGSGLLQLYTVDMDIENLGDEEFAIGLPKKEMEFHKHEEILERNYEGVKVEDCKLMTCEQPTSGDLDMKIDKTAKVNEERSELRTDVDRDNDITVSDDDIKEDIEVIEETGNAPCVDNVDYNADDEHEADVVITDVINGDHATLKRFNTHRESDVDSGIGYSSTGTDTLPPRGRVHQREANMKHQPFKADHGLLPLKSEVDVDILDEVNLVHLSHDLLKSHDHRGRRGNSAIEERDDTDVRLGVAKVSEKERKISEKYRRARSPSPYILRNRQSPAGFRPKSAPSFAQSELDIRVVDIPLTENSSTGSQNIVTKRNSSHSQPESVKNVKTISKNVSCQNTDIFSKYSSLPNLTSNNSKDSKTNPSNNVSSSRLVKQRKCSMSSISSKDSSISLLSENEDDLNVQTCNLSYDDGMEDEFHSPEDADDDDYAKEIDEEKFTEIELDSGTNIENLAEQKPSELKKMIKGMYQPSVTSPRVKEKRLKIRNILKQKKGTFTPPVDDKKPPEEKNAVNRIYAKARDIAGGYENVSKKPMDSLQAGVKSTFAMIPISNADIGSNGAYLKPEFDKSHKTNTDNSVVRTTPFDSATSVGKDSDSVDKFISGAGGKTVTAEPVLVDLTNKRLNCGKNIVAENRTGDSNRINVQVERAISPAKSQPPQKPVRTKNKNKNLNVLADQLNFSKYKIKVEDGQSATSLDTRLQSATPLDTRLQSATPLDTRLQSATPLDTRLCVGTESSEHSPRSQTSAISDSNPEHSKKIPAQLSSGTTRERVPSQLSRVTSGESEIEEWKPLHSNVVSDNKVEKKRGSKGKFKMFKKALSMDRGIETVGMDQNPTGQTPQTSKEGHSNFPKVKKALSLKSFTSLFNRRKKKKGQFVIEDVENASKNVSSLGRNEPTHPLSNGKQKHWASCHSLETMNSPIHHQPIRKQNTESSLTHQEIQPMGKLVKINPDGTQIIKLMKPENGPMGFFIAKGSAKFGNGIFVSRFTEERSEQSFAGLLGIGDEIIEVNSHVVRDLTQDAVYNLMSDKTVLLVKVFPFIARKDV